MRYRKLDANGDYTFGHGASDFYINVPEAVGQAIVSRFRLNLGEWFVDTSDGTPWETEIQGYSDATRDLAVQDRMNGTMGLTQITSYQSSLSAQRKFAVGAIVETQYGQIVVVVNSAGASQMQTYTGNPAPYSVPALAPTPPQYPLPTPSPV